jgi:uncharacterized protein DUF3237
VRLEHLVDLDLTYRGEYVVARPYPGGAGRGYGSGDGTALGPRLHGGVRFANHPGIRGDGVLLADLHGVIETEDGAQVVFSLQGYGLPAGEGARIDALLAATFECQDERYRWLGTTFGVGEALADKQGGVNVRIYSCTNDLVGSAG